MKPLHVQIGTWSADYVVVETTAPRAYDGATSITIGEDAERRWVAVEIDQHAWHLGRYSSGGYYANEADVTLRALEKVLTERLLKAEGEL